MLFQLRFVVLFLSKFLRSHSFLGVALIIGPGFVVTPFVGEFDSPRSSPTTQLRPGGNQLLERSLICDDLYDALP